MRLLQRLKNLFLPEGEVSDGFHTFDELYHYRMLYNAAFFNSLEGKSINPTGQVSNHYRAEEWNLFNVPERWKADEWDGHTPVEAANRLYRFSLYYDKWHY